MHLTRRRFMGSALAAGASVAAPSLARAAAPTQRIGGAAFGTNWQLTAPAGIRIGRLRPLVEAVVADVDIMMSPWRRDSGIARFNGAQDTAWFPVHPDIASVAQAALRLQEASGGVFDPTVGPMVGRWGFGPISAPMPPRGSRVAVQEDALRKTQPAMTLDLCGIAKGFAVDRIAGALRGEGAEAFVIDLGGEIAAHGSHPSGRAWQVGVEDPRQGWNGAAEILALRGKAVATSGDKVNGFSLGGRRYGHIIDPSRGSPVEGAASSVSVIADDAMSADGWATALVAAGPRGPQLAELNGLHALFLFDEGEDLRRVATGRFDVHLA